LEIYNSGQNKAVVYNLLFAATAETLRTIGADPKHLGAEIGFFAARSMSSSGITTNIPSRSNRSPAQNPYWPKSNEFVKLSMDHTGDYQPMATTR
jgi:hypothetical protein